MHSRLAGSRGDCVERELEQGAGGGPLRCYGDDATPAGDVSCTHSRADGSVRTRGALLCKEPQQGCGFRASAQSPQRKPQGGSAASATARGRCRDACALLRAEKLRPGRESAR